MKPPRIFLILLFIAAIISGAVQLLAHFAAGNGNQRPDIQLIIWTDNPSDSSVVSWITSGIGKESENVFYDTIPRYGDTTKYAFRTRPVSKGMVFIENTDPLKEVSKGYQHLAKLKALSPSTNYYFVIETLGFISEEYHFTTAPAVTVHSAVFFP